MEKIKKEILITGLSGMLGEDLIPRFSPKYNISGIDINPPQAKDIDFFYADITEKMQIKDVFVKIKPWLVIHTAAYTDVDGCERNPEKADKINAIGTKNIAELCLKINAKLIYISTDYVFDGEKGTPYNENDSACPLNEYGRSKLKGENFLRSLLTEFLIIRTSWLFGRNGKNFVDTIIEKAKQMPTLKVVDDQRGSPTYTVDLAEALDRLIEAVFNISPDKNKAGIYNVSNGNSCSWYEFAKKILEVKKIPTEILPIDSATIARPARRPKFSVLDNSRYQKVTGHNLCTWEETLLRYLS